MAGTSNSIITHNVLKGTLNSDNVISGLVNTAFNPAYALVTQAGAQIVLFINSSDYKMYAQLKDKNGNLIYTSNVIDLPLETMVVDGRYDSNTKKLVLVLDNGNEIEIPLGALISGLVNEDDLEANYYDKNEIDTLLEGYWTKIEITQEDIDNWNAKQEYLNQGDGIEISAETTLKGNTSQESTTGKNILDLSKNAIYNQYASKSFNEPKIEITKIISNSSSFCLFEVGNASELNGKSLILSGKCLASGTAKGRAILGYADANGENRVAIVDKATLGNGEFNGNMVVDGATYSTKKVVLWLYSDTSVPGNIGDKITYEDVMVSTTGGDYEPYTGGNPAPNPDYPYPVNVVTGDNEVKVEGKNLAYTGWAEDFVTAINDSNYAKLEVKDNRNCLFYVQNAGYGQYDTKNFTLGMTFKENTQYTISYDIFKSTTNSRTVAIYYTDGTNTQSSNLSELNKWEHQTITSSAGKTIDYICLYYTSGSTYIDINTWQIEEGTTETTYEPYQSQTYPINLGSMELCKIGDYQDYIYKNNGNWYKYGAIGKVVLDGSENWINQSGVYDTETRMFFSVRISSLRANINNRKGISNYFINSNTSVQSPYVDTTAFSFHPEAQYSNYIYIKIDKNQLSSQDATGFKNWLSNHNTIVYFQIDPTITEITDTTLIEQLDNLSIGLSNKWIKNISQTNTDLPFEIKYDNKNLTISASSNLVRNTDYANYSTAGVVKSNLSFETDNNGGAKCSIIEYSNYPSANNRNFISKGTLENVITGKELTNKTYVDAANAAFQSELFDDGVISIEDSTEANINNTMNKSQLKIDLKGNTSQESTTGKNLFDISKVLTNGTALVNNGNGTITVTTPSNNSQVVASEPRKLKDYCPNLQVGDSVYLTANSTGTSKYIYLTTTAQVWSFGTQRTITQNDLDSNVGWYASGVSTTATISEIMVSISGGDYEPYTGGNPAPNPDYPYPVNVVTGDNEVKVEGKNLLNRATCEENKLIRWVQGDTYNETGSLVSDYIRVNVGDNISCSYACQKAFYDKDKNYIGVLNGDGTIIPNGTNANTLSSFVVPNVSNVYYMKLGFRATYSRGVNLLTANIMVNKGETLGNYEPYQSQTYPINLGSMELCKIGDYQDYIARSTGKNLAKEYISGYPNGSVWGTSGSTRSIVAEVKPNTRYTVKKYAGNRFTIVESNMYPVANTPINTLYSNNGVEGEQTETITTSSTTKYLITFVSNQSLEPNVMVNEGNTSLPYEPYGKVWYKYGAIGKVVLDGSENWSAYTNTDSQGNTYGYYVSLNKQPLQETRLTTFALSNQFIQQRRDAVSIVDKQGIYLGSGITMFVKIAQSLISGGTLANFKNWLSSNNLIVYYALATPTITPITDTTLIEQLDNLEKAYSYDTQTNISQTNQDKPFILDINAIANNVNGLKLENENQEYKTNKVIELSSNSTDDEYPSAKCIYDIVGNIEAVLAAMDSGSGV